MCNMCSEQHMHYLGRVLYCLRLEVRASDLLTNSYTQKHHLTLHTLCSPLHVKNTDRSLNKSGPICFTTIQTFYILTSNNQYHQECFEFYITSLATHDIILGTNWLNACNPNLIGPLLSLPFHAAPCLAPYS